MTRTRSQNIILLWTDDTSRLWRSGPLRPAGEGRGMPTPPFLIGLGTGRDTFFSFMPQPSCTPGRAAMVTRSESPTAGGMTTVAPGSGGRFAGQRKVDPASVLKTGRLPAPFSRGKWHLVKPIMPAAQLPRRL